MNRVFVRCLAAVCFLSAGSAIHADQISYSFSTSSPSMFFSQNGFGMVALRDHSGTLPASITTSTKPVTISTNVVALGFSTSSASQPISAPLYLTLTDKSSQGNIVSTVSDKISLNTISNPSSTLQTVKLGSHTYQIQLASDTLHTSQVNLAPGSNAGSGLYLNLTYGKLSFSISDPPGGPHTSSTPEPSSLVLAGIALPLFGVYLRRRRRAV